MEQFPSQSVLYKKIWTIYAVNNTKLFFLHPLLQQQQKSQINQIRTPINWTPSQPLLLPSAKPKKKKPNAILHSSMHPQRRLFFSRSMLQRRMSATMRSAKFVRAKCSMRKCESPKRMPMHRRIYRKWSSLLSTGWWLFTDSTRYSFSPCVLSYL